LFDPRGEGTTVLLYVGNDSSDNITSFISNFRCVLNVVCFLLGNSLVSEVYTPTFQNTLFHHHRKVGVCRMNYV
jgi:hypothetical protein